MENKATENESKDLYVDWKNHWWIILIIIPSLILRIIKNKRKTISIANHVSTYQKIPRFRRGETCIYPSTTIQEGQVRNISGMLINTRAWFCRFYVLCEIGNSQFCRNIHLLSKIQQQTHIAPPNKDFGV